MSIAVRTKKTAKKRIRRTPEQARADALRVARELLLKRGPNAVTLQAVAADIGMTHTNLLHHFGSAAGLQAALMTEMTRELTNALEHAVQRFRSGKADAEELVSLVFDAFDEGGAGRLAAWISISGEPNKLEAIGEVVQSYLEHIGEEDASREARARISSASFLVTLVAFGDAVIGETVGTMMRRDRNTARRMIAKLLPVLLTEYEGA